MAAKSRGNLTVAPAVDSDRAAIHRTLLATGLFRPNEIAVALEVLDVYLHREDQTDYQVYSAHRNNNLAGYVCFGLNTLTDGVFELYWIAVNPPDQAKGVGSCLMDLAEGEAIGQDGRIMVVETSSREDYRGTLSFYLRRGYREVARVADFYTVGDDKLILVKDLK